MVSEDDYIFLYGGERAQFLIKYNKANSTFHSHLGVLEIPPDLNYGDFLKTNTGHIFYVLKPTTSDLVFKVKRTTTIMYPKDIGYIIMESGIGFGSKIIECGTGSGALTIALASVVGKSGRVYSFERRPEFLKNAQKNVERAGFSDIVEYYNLDIAESSIPVTSADAAVIDVPEPWKVVGNLKPALNGGSTCAFLSPNIEQVQLTVNALRENSFVRIRTAEIFERKMLIREGKTRPAERMVSHTGYLTFATSVTSP